LHEIDQPRPRLDFEHPARNHEDRAIAQGWLWRHESGTYVKFSEAGAALFA
jgi:hypothetical protein